MKYLSKRKLESILRWADWCRQDNAHHWGKADDNLYQDVEKEIKNLSKEYYQIYKKFKSKRTLSSN